MRTLLLLTVTSALALGLMGGCGDDDDDGGSGGSGGTTGGTGGGGTGGGGTAGADGGGAAGADGGGAAGADGGGTDAGDSGSGFWPAAYNASCTPTATAPTGHNALAGVDCLTCHATGGAAASKPWLFGGVIYTNASATQGAANVEVGVKDGANFYYTCTDANGFFAEPLPSGSTTVAWNTAEIRMRSATGDDMMNSKSAQQGTCNAAGCHGATVKLIKP